MSCCVIGCKNRYSPSSSIKFYRIPCGVRAFHVTRRRLWIKAIQQANGNTDELKGDVRICGAHFVSGEASLNTDSQDFVPSVFTRKQHKKKWKCRRKNRHQSRVDPRKEAEPSPHGAASPQALHTSVSIETEKELSGEIPSLSPSSVPKEKEASTKDGVTETETPESKQTFSFYITSTKQTHILQLHKMSPVVLLKSIVLPERGYRCEQCAETFVSVSHLVKHKQLHEEEKPSDSIQADVTEPQPVATDELSFPCNMCNRSFTTSHNLKRHKLLHVKDGRKCLQCGTLFCRRHNRILFRPRPEREAKPVDDSCSAEAEDLDSSVSLEKMEPSQTTEASDDTPPPTSAPTDEPLVPLSDSLPKTNCVSADIRNPVLVSVIPAPAPRPPSPIFHFLKNTHTSFQWKPPVPDYPPAFVQPHLPQHPELPSSLKIFSPQYLTSALLNVQRNYNYILSKAKTEEVKNIEEEKPEEPVFMCPAEQTLKQTKREKIAYDLEIIL